MNASDKRGAGLTRPAIALTHRTLESFRADLRPYRVPDARTPGLAARVATSGAVTWDCSFRIAGTGKVRRTSLGRWPADATLEEARERAGALLKAARAGRNLLAEEKESRRRSLERITVAQLIDEYVRRRVKGRLRSAAPIESRLKRALAGLLDRPADDVRRRDIRAELDAAAETGLRREVEQRRQNVSVMWKWAVAADLVDSNPTADLPKYPDSPLRERVLSDEEIAAIWPWLDTCGMPTNHAKIIRLCLLMGPRCGEVAGMSAEEVDTENKLWILPPARSKSGQQRVTPLVGAVWEIVADRLKAVGTGLLFPTQTGKPLTAAHVGQVLLCRELPVAPFVTHDLRRTVATNLVDMGFGLETAAAVLGHAVGGAKVATLRRHYLRTDHLEPKRRALEAWGNRVADIVSGRVNENRVIDFTSLQTRHARAAAG